MAENLRIFWVGKQGLLAQQNKAEFIISETSWRNQFRGGGGGLPCQALRTKATLFLSISSLQYNVSIPNDEYGQGWSYHDAGRGFYDLGLICLPCKWICLRSLHMYKHRTMWKSMWKFHIHLQKQCKDGGAFNRQWKNGETLQDSLSLHSQYKDSIPWGLRAESAVSAPPAGRDGETDFDSRRKGSLPWALPERGRAAVCFFRETSLRVCMCVCKLQSPDITALGCWGRTLWLWSAVWDSLVKLTDRSVLDLSQFPPNLAFLGRKVAMKWEKMGCRKVTHTHALLWRNVAWPALWTIVCATITWS